MRIFIGFVEIAGHYQKLSDGLRQLGYDVVFVGGSAHPFQYSSASEGKGKDYALPWLYERINKFRHKDRLNVFNKTGFGFGTVAVKFMMFIWALFRCDVFIFGAGQSFSRTGLDLWLLRISGKTIIANIGHGSEARPAYLNGAMRSQDGTWPALSKLQKKAKRTFNKIRMIEHHAHAIIASPFTSQFLNRVAIDYFYIGQSAHLTGGELNARRSDGHVHILHAPSNRISKGTHEIKKAIAEIQATHSHVEFIEVSGMTNSEVLKAIAQCDIVIDQLYSDSPFTGIALEASSFGVPVVVGGHGFNDAYFMTAFMKAYPTVVCKPSEIKTQLIDLIANPEKRTAIGEEARKFVFDTLGKIEVARRYENIILGRVEPEAYFDPKQCNYCLGVALSLDDLRDILTRYVHQFGMEGLYLQDRADLQSWIGDFISDRRQ